MTATSRTRKPTDDRLKRHLLIRSAVISSAPFLCANKEKPAPRSATFAEARWKSSFIAGKHALCARAWRMTQHEI